MFKMHLEKIAGKNKSKCSFRIFPFLLHLNKVTVRVRILKLSILTKWFFNKFRHYQVIASLLPLLTNNLKVFILNIIL